MKRALSVLKLDDFWKKVKKSFEPKYHSETEEYLSKSDDLFDLERRIKLLQRRGIL